MRALVTGGAGFVGANLVHHTLRERPGVHLTVLDAFTYAANRESVPPSGPRLTVVEGDVTDPEVVDSLVAASDLVIHVAAETHNDNALADPAPFVRTNVLGTFTVLEAVRRHGVRLHHVSTDEVFGDLPLDDPVRFAPGDPYDPSSPYSATKASSDHLVRAWVRSYGIEATLSACSNNYGPYQHVEKLIPRTVTTVLDGGRPQLYGSGENVRDWIHVEDHVRGLWAVVDKGAPGRTYLLGADGEHSNRAVVETVLELLDRPRDGYDLVADRPGHDLRCAVDASRAREELGWAPQRTSFREGLRETIAWYRDNEAWWRPSKASTEAAYSARQSAGPDGRRLGTGGTG